MQFLSVMRLKKVAFLFCFLLIASSAFADDASLNIEFQKALYLIEKGDPLDAVPILEKLFQETGAPEKSQTRVSKGADALRATRSSQKTFY